MSRCEKLENYIGKLAEGGIHATRSGILLREILEDMRRDIKDEDRFREAAYKVVDDVCKAMPPYATLINVLNDFCLSLEGKSVAQKTHANGYEVMERIACSLIKNDSVICTYTFSQTLSDCFIKCSREKNFSVIVTESSPNRDGVDTAKLLNDNGIRCITLPDADMDWAAAQADMAIFGCEGVLPDGSIITKVGLSQLARSCIRRKKEVYVYAGCGKLLPGELFSIANRTQRRFTQDGISCRFFDITPAGSISGIITEKGIISPAQASRFANGQVSQYLVRNI